MSGELEVRETEGMVPATAEKAFEGTEKMGWVVLEGETGAFGFSKTYEEACKIAETFSEDLVKVREEAGEEVDGDYPGFRIMKTVAFVSIRKGQGEIVQVES